MGHYHVFGTDRTGNDVLYQAMKSVRTAFVIGTLATVATLPFAVVLGILAGYFRGWVDEVIQYLYTTLSSVPNVLLIAACVLMVQVFLDKNPDLFETGLERSDRFSHRRVGPCPIRARDLRIGFRHQQPEHHGDRQLHLQFDVPDREVGR